LSGVDETQHGHHHIVKWHRCANLVIGDSPQQGLNGLDVLEDTTEFLRRLAYELLVLVASRSARVSSGALSRMMWSTWAWTGMDAERSPGGASPRQAEVVRSRLRSFEAALRALQAPGDRLA
jgi:hypothetical protein